MAENHWSKLSEEKVVLRLESRMNKPGNKRPRECVTFHIWRLANWNPSPITHSPQHPEILDGKSCISFAFLQLLGGFQEMLPPNSRLLCDAEGMLEKSKRQRIRIPTPCSEKLMMEGKSKNPMHGEAARPQSTSSKVRDTTVPSLLRKTLLLTICGLLKSVVNHHWSSSEGRKSLCCCGCAGWFMVFLFKYGTADLM